MAENLSGWVVPTSSRVRYGSKLVPHIPDHAIILSTLCCFRFYVWQYHEEYLEAWIPRPWSVDPELWYVVDMATPETLKAKGTQGFKTKEQAVEMAREYRDEYGGYWPFLF